MLEVKLILSEQRVDLKVTFVRILFQIDNSFLCDALCFISFVSTACSNKNNVHLFENLICLKSQLGFCEGKYLLIYNLA